MIDGTGRGKRAPERAAVQEQDGNRDSGCGAAPDRARHLLAMGLRDGFPICLGYFAVAFALGIAAKQAGLGAFYSGVMSLGMVASAGEFAAISLLSAGAGVLEMIATCFVVNLRYLLMSCALSQKLSPSLPVVHRFFLAQTITDELFGLAAGFDGYLKPIYSYAAFFIAVSGWVAGTVLGVLAGNILPPLLVSALGVSLYGMFLAIIIPPAKRNRFLGILVVISMLVSGLTAYLPYVKNLSSGFRVTVLTLLIASAAAVIRPLPDEPDGDTGSDGGAAGSAGGAGVPAGAAAAGSEGARAGTAADGAARKGGEA